MNYLKRWKWSALPEAVPEEERGEVVADINSQQACTWDEALAWIVSRDIDQVALAKVRFGQLSNLGPESVAFLANILACRDIDAKAEKSLIRSLNSQKVTAEGYEVKTGDRKKIPADAWRTSTVVFEHSACLSPSVGHQATWQQISIEWAGLRSEYPNCEPATARSINRFNTPPTRRPTKRHKYLFTYFRFAHDQIQDATKLEAREKYIGWLEIYHPRETAFGRTIFENLLEHYKDGWIIDNDQWVCKNG